VALLHRQALLVVAELVGLRLSVESHRAFSAESYLAFKTTEGHWLLLRLLLALPAADSPLLLETVLAVVES